MENFGFPKRIEVIIFQRLGLAAQTKIFWKPLIPIRRICLKIKYGADNLAAEKNQMTKREPTLKRAIK